MNTNGTQLRRQCRAATGLCGEPCLACLRCAFRALRVAAPWAWARIQAHHLVQNPGQTYGAALFFFAGVRQFYECAYVLVHEDHPEIDLRGTIPPSCGATKREARRHPCPLSNSAGLNFSPSSLFPLPLLKGLYARGLRSIGHQRLLRVETSRRLDP